MKIEMLIAFILIVSSGCIINTSGAIRYNGQFNTVSRVNEPLDEIGVIHSLSDRYGRGLMKIRDKSEIISYYLNLAVFFLSHSLACFLLKANQVQNLSLYVL